MRLHGAGIMARSLDLRLRGRAFDSRLLRCQTTTLGKLFTHMFSATEQYKLVPVKGRRCPTAGKVTVGLASSHWPVVLSIYGLKGPRKRDEQSSYTLHGDSHSLLDHATRIVRQPYEYMIQCHSYRSSGSSVNRATDPKGPQRQRKDARTTVFLKRCMNSRTARMRMFRRHGQLTRKSRGTSDEFLWTRFRFAQHYIL